MSEALALSPDEGEYGPSCNQKHFACNFGHLHILPNLPCTTGHDPLEVRFSTSQLRCDAHTVSPSIWKESLTYNIGHFAEQVWHFLVFVCKFRRVTLSAVVDVQGGSNVPPVSRSSRRRPLSSPRWCVFYDGFVICVV